jgi:hypothetical protein
MSLKQGWQCSVLRQRAIRVCRYTKSRETGVFLATAKLCQFNFPYQRKFRYTSHYMSRRIPYL